MRTSLESCLNALFGRSVVTVCQVMGGASCARLEDTVKRWSGELITPGEADDSASMSARALPSRAAFARLLFVICQLAHQHCLGGGRGEPVFQGGDMSEDQGHDWASIAWRNA